MENFKYIIILLLALIGVVNVIKSVIISLCRDNGGYCKIVIPLDDRCENPETVIRNTVLRNEWSDRKDFMSIYCIYKGKNKESMEICQRVCEEYPFTHYININNFEKSVFYDE